RLSVLARQPASAAGVPCERGVRVPFSAHSTTPAPPPRGVDAVWAPSQPYRGPDRTRRNLFPPGHAARSGLASHCLGRTPPRVREERVDVLDRANSTRAEQLELSAPILRTNPWLHFCVNFGRFFESAKSFGCCRSFS